MGAKKPISVATRKFMETSEKSFAFSLTRSEYSNGASLEECLILYEFTSKISGTEMVLPNLNLPTQFMPRKVFSSRGKNRQVSAFLTAAEPKANLARSTEKLTQRKMEDAQRAR